MFFRSVVASLILVAGLAAAVPAAAQGNTRPIAVLNLNAIRHDSKAVKDIRRQIEHYVAALQASNKKEDEALRKANEQLMRRRSILSPEAFAKERQKFQQHYFDLQRQNQEHRQQIAEVQAEAMKKVEDKLNQIVRDIAKKRGYALVLSGVQAVVLDRNLDITKETLDQLDKSLPAVKVKNPKTVQVSPPSSRSGSTPGK